MSETIFVLIILLFSIILHELAHGSVAYNLGDPTAKYSGRLSLNPLKHLDPFGSVILPLFLLVLTGGEGPILGWAKPVPINPYNFRDQKWGNLKVAIAGPSINFLVAILFGLLARFFFFGLPLLRLFTIIVFYNFFWGLFNLIPIPPLDGSHILFTFLSDKYFQLKILLQQYSLFILFLLIFSGLLNWLFDLALFLSSVIIS
jgi:Zn-dependent protease